FEKSIERSVYDRQRDKLREQIARNELELSEAAFDEIDAEGILAFAKQALTNIDRLWDQASVESRRRLQSVFFPEGVTFDPGSTGGKRGGFRTAATCLAFMEMRQFSGLENGLASPTGFEPVLPP